MTGVWIAALLDCLHVTHEGISSRWQGRATRSGRAAMDRRIPGSSFTQRGRVWWFGTAGALLFVLVTGMALPLDRLWNLHTAAAPSVIAPKVLTVSMFQTGDPLAGGSGEASVWVENDHLDQVVPIPGSYSPLYCNASFEHCLVITGVLAANAAATVMAVGLSERVDLSHSYIMVAGIGGGPPDKITVGAAAWADWIVSGDLVTELDAREMPPDWQYPKAYLGCAHPW